VLATPTRDLVHGMHRGRALARRIMSSTIEDTIDRVERLYVTITGHPPPIVDGSGPRIPPDSDPVQHVEDQLGRLVIELEQRFAPEPTSAVTWVPRACTWRDDTGFELLVDVPGVPRDRLELSVDDRTLHIRGTRPAPWHEGEPPYACESPFGSFARAFALPERVEPGQITARLDVGTLRVRIARAPRFEVSQIPITCS
jgi:HSP20 family molecular chaperone IbpA